MTIEIFKGYNVRIEIKDGKIWYNLPDICKVLELSNPTMVARGIKESALTKIEGIDSMGRNQKSNYVNDRGLLRLMNRSYSKNVEEFQDWIDERAEQMLQGKTVNAAGVVKNPYDGYTALDWMKLAVKAEEEKLALEERNKELEPKAEVHDKVLDTEGSLGFMDVLRSLQDDYPELKQKMLSNIMRANKLIQKNTVDSTAEARKKGYAKDIATGNYGGKKRMQTRWTPEGIQLIIALVKETMEE